MFEKSILHKFKLSKSGSFDMLAVPFTVQVVLWEAHVAFNDWFWSNLEELLLKEYKNSFAFFKNQKKGRWKNEYVEITV